MLKFSTSFPPITSPDALRASWRRTQEALEAVPGVVDASLTEGATPTEGDSELPFWFAGQPKPATQADMKVSLFYLVQPSYLNVMRTPLVRGRFLTAQDDEHSPFVMVIDERFRQLYFGDQDPIGRRVNFDLLNMTAEIVGVVGHVKQWGLGENPLNADPGAMLFQYGPNARPVTVIACHGHEHGGAHCRAAARIRKFHPARLGADQQPTGDVRR